MFTVCFVIFVMTAGVTLLQMSSAAFWTELQEKKSQAKESLVSFNVVWLNLAGVGMILLGASMFLHETVTKYILAH